MCCDWLCGLFGYRPAQANQEGQGYRPLDGTTAQQRAQQFRSPVDDVRPQQGSHPGDSRRVERTTDGVARARYTSPGIDHRQQGIQSDRGICK